MLEDTFANRLKLALRIRKIKQADLSKKTGINKSLISSYLTGTFKPKQDKLTLLAKALKVQESWLMGFNVEMDRKNESHDSNIIDSLKSEEQDEILKKYLNVKNKLTKDDKETILFILDKRSNKQ